ncbi:MAG: 50S ribosomal protein L11 methyltransferase [Casimicrobiaceae bacterium]
MSYVTLRFDVDAAHADAWSDALLDAGVLAVDVSDPAAGTPAETPIYAEPGEPDAALWKLARLASLCASGTDADALLRRCADALGTDVPAHDVGAVAEQDWVRATQAQFGPLNIADRFWIVPSWCAPPDPAALNLALDPGLAFGTGSHPTTRLCLEWLAERVSPGCSLLDYGCGSGILAIAAAKLGAGRVAGTDIDTQALRAAADNARANCVDIALVAPDALPDRTYDIVVANILTNPLRVLAPALAMRVREGGSIALAGLLDTQAAQVADAYARWFNIAPWRTADGWSLLAGVRRPDRTS